MNDGTFVLPERLDDPDGARIRRALLRSGVGRRVALDASRVETADALGVARLLRLVSDLRAAGVRVELAETSEALRRALAQVDAAVIEQDRPPARHPLEAVGGAALEALDAARAGRDARARHRRASRGVGGLGAVACLIWNDR